MRKRIQKRLALVTAMMGIGVAGAFTVGCSGDDDNDGTGTTNDGGRNDASNVGDGGNNGDSAVGDGGTQDGATGDGGMGDGSTDAAPPPAFPRVVFLHASPDLPAVRFCFATNPNNNNVPGTVAAMAPIPSTALQPGSAAAAPDFNLDLWNLQVTPYAILGDTTKTCDQLVGAAGIGVDGGALDPSVAIKLAPIPTTTFVSGSSYVVSVSGCLPVGSGPGQDPNATIVHCGGNYTGASTLAARVDRLDTTTPAPANGIGAQFALRSPSIAQSVGGAGAVSAAFLVPMNGDAGTDSGADAGTASDSGSSDDGGGAYTVVPITSAPVGNAADLSALALATGVNLATAQIAVFPGALPADGGAPNLQTAIATAKVSDLGKVGRVGGNATISVGASYSFFLIGDTSPFIGSTGRQVQIVAVPNVPAFAMP